MYASRPKWLPGVLPLQPTPPPPPPPPSSSSSSPPPRFLALQYYIQLLGSVSLSPPLTFLFLNHLLQSLHPARPKWRCSVWRRKEYRYIVRRIGTRDFFFFLASYFLDLGMKYKTQDRRKKKESEIKQKRKNEEEEKECSLEEWGGALCDG